MLLLPSNYFSPIIPWGQSPSMKAANLSNCIRNHVFFFVLRASPRPPGEAQAVRGCLSLSSNSPPPPNFRRPWSPNTWELSALSEAGTPLYNRRPSGHQDVELCLWRWTNGTECGWLICDANEGSRDIILRTMDNAFRARKSKNCIRKQKDFIWKANTFKFFVKPVSLRFSEVSLPSIYPTPKVSSFC